MNWSTRERSAEEANRAADILRYALSESHGLLMTHNHLTDMADALAHWQERTFALEKEVEALKSDPTAVPPEPTYRPYIGPLEAGKFVRMGDVYHPIVPFPDGGFGFRLDAINSPNAYVRISPTDLHLQLYEQIEPVKPKEFEGYVGTTGAGHARVLVPDWFGLGTRVKVIEIPEEKPNADPS